jgi:hypothetical protein
MCVWSLKKAVAAARVSKKAASFLSQVFLCWDRTGGGKEGETTSAGRTSGERGACTWERQEDRGHVETVFPSVKSCGECIR